MNILPVTSSILSPDALLQFTREKYLITDTFSCRLLKAGINHTYKIDNGITAYILRVYSYNWRTKVEIEEELRLLELLKSNGISISYPLPDKSGEYIQSINAPEGERYAVLFSFAQGRKILSYSNRIHSEAGRLMAQIHSLTENLKLNRDIYNEDVLLDRSVEFIGGFLEAETMEMHYLRETVQMLKTELAKADLSKIRKGVVHLDIWFDNFNISADNKITVFDFDFCGNGWLCMDIAYYIMQVYHLEKDDVERQAKVKSFWGGYTSVLPISGQERNLLDVLGSCLYCYYLGIQCYRFNNWLNVFINEVYLKRYIEVFIRGYYEKTKDHKF